ncbi:MAG: hypothetical protein RIT19_338, partial [Verrucomicrobiota bacterium]
MPSELASRETVHPTVLRIVLLL